MKIKTVRCTSSLTFEKTVDDLLSSGFILKDSGAISITKSSHSNSTTDLEWWAILMKTEQKSSLCPR